MDWNSFGLDCVRHANLHGASTGQMLGDGGADQPFNNAKEQVPDESNKLFYFSKRKEFSSSLNYLSAPREGETYSSRRD
jgi:hypothetical protein